jgi:hypothetical protein
MTAYDRFVSYDMKQLSAVPTIYIKHVLQPRQQQLVIHSIKCREVEEAERGYFAMTVCHAEVNR